MTIKTSILSPVDADARLDQMGLTRSIPVDALTAGYNHAARCTDLHPASLAGTLVWGEALAEFRSLTRPRGWSVRREGNFERAVSPGNQFAVAVVLGNSATGRADLVPSTKRPRGPLTEGAVKGNYDSFDTLMETGGELGPEEAFPAKHPQTYFLLHFPDRAVHGVRCELSLPMSMKGSMIDAWAERILLGTIPLGPDVEILDVPDDGGADEIVVPIRRKAN